jgi:murein DD-endopeptidase MepM/ murein hydrolase activator NlpD
MTRRLQVKVDSKGINKGYGQYVVIAGAAGSTVYAHLGANTVYVSVGQTVAKGDLIALSGNTGTTSGAHLHFEYIPNGKVRDNLDRAFRVLPFDRL